jgi:hypothetical protein
MRIRTNIQVPKHVPKCGDQVDGQEQAEDEELQCWIICQSSEKESRNSRFICWLHGTGKFYQKD